MFHAAGLGGRGSASYIDAVAFRDKDTTAWTANGRTPLDQRHYSLLNWRSDVVVIVTDAGALVQHARYNDSGSPWGVPAGDVNGDGIVNTVDTGILLGAIGGAYVARYDLNLDGTVDAADHTIGNNNLGDTLGHNALSLNPSSDARGGHRLGYTGHTHADFNNALIVMRHRWYSGDLGRFMSRDPLGFVDGQNVYAYARGNGVSGRDPMGLYWQDVCVRGVTGGESGCAGGGSFNELSHAEAAAMSAIEAVGLDHLSMSGGSKITAAACREACKKLDTARQRNICEKMVCRSLRNATCTGLLSLCRHHARHRAKTATEACLLVCFNICGKARCVL